MYCAQCFHGVLTVTVLLYTPTYQQELKVLVQRILLHFLAFYCLNDKKFELL